MARKVFISVLGTGFYSECVYKMGEFTSDTTRFIQQATLQMLTQQNVGGEWTKNDQIYIILTEKAKEYNWDIPSGKRYNPKDKKDEPYIGLKSVLEQMHRSTPIEVIDIPVGNNEDEIWTIFDRIYKKLDREDRLYLDLTHAFRYIPMLLLVLVNYSKFLNRTNVEQITYGNWENRDCSKKPEVAQIIDITPLAALQDWTNAAADYLEHGDAAKLRECASIPLRNISRMTRGQDAAAAQLKRLTDCLSDFCQVVSLNRGKRIIQATESYGIKTNLQGANESYVKPLTPLFNSISDSVKDFKTGSINNMLLAANMSFKHQNFQSAITLLEEWLITLLCKRTNLDYHVESERDLISFALNKNKHCCIPECGAYRKKDDDTEAVIDDILSKIVKLGIDDREFAELWNKITTARNDINHAGFNGKAGQTKTLRKNIKTTRQNASALMISFEGIETSQSYSSLLINLSNHPYENWSAEQKEAAKEYGEVRDMPFPAIDPEEDTEQIRERADEYISKIIKLNAEYAITVHLMGEMSFVVYAVSRLTERGIRCICSTSERDTEDLSGGEKKVSFHFKRFRDYDC